jgi:hypothetical protein
VVTASALTGCPGTPIRVKDFVSPRAAGGILGEGVDPRPLSPKRRLSSPISRCQVLPLSVVPQTLLSPWLGAVGEAPLAGVGSAGRESRGRGDATRGCEPGLFEETGLRVELMPEPAAVAVRSYHPDHSVTLGLSYAAVVDAAAPLVAETGQPVAWKRLNEGWESYFPDDPSRICQHAVWMAHRVSRH